MKVLVIEDNPDNMILICDILELNGYATVCATTGRDGVSLAEEQEPDFILLDIQLPDIDGYEVLDIIRSNERTKRNTVIAITSYAMAGDQERLINKGCDGYIEKPIDPNIIMKQIKDIIGKVA